MPNAPRTTPDPIAAQFISLIRDELKRQGMSIRQFANLCGISQQYMSLMLNQPCNMGSGTMCHYMEVLGLTPVLAATVGTSELVEAGSA